MQWKQNLRRALENQGHRIAPIHRDSPKRKGVPLAQSSNTYIVACNNCDLHFTIETIPGEKTEDKGFDPMIYSIKCRKARASARKEQNNGAV